MADNAQKRALCNRAITILQAGRTSAAGVLHTSITDEQFADYSLVTDDTQKMLLCFLYEDILKQVILDIQPDFAVQFADLGAEIRINKDIADWSYLFELPSDFLDLVAQVDQTDKDTEYKAKILTFDSYAHVVTGTDDQSYKCKLDVTASAATRPITGSYSTNWELYDADDLGADWVSGWAYKASQSGKLLATNTYSNSPSETVDSDIDSAYIKYLAYTRAGISDKPEYYPNEFKNAFCIRLAAEMAQDGKDYERRLRLLAEYEELAKPRAWQVQNQNDYEEDKTTILEARTE
jgi:hypothetical protein